jgi:hypothetical protein
LKSKGRFQVQGFRGSRLKQKRVPGSKLNIKAGSRFKSKSGFRVERRDFAV